MTFFKGAVVVVAGLVAGPAWAEGDAGAGLQGRFLGPGAECPQFETLDGEQISLTGLPLPQDLAEGDRLVLTGRFLMVSTCMQGRAFDVETIALDVTAD
jgi:hypothetical protein